MSESTYEAIFKCRLCGEVFTHVTTGRALAIRTIVELTCDGHKSSEPLLSMFNEHFCKDGSVGIADFNGWKKKDNMNVKQLDWFYNNQEDEHNPYTKGTYEQGCIDGRKGFAEWFAKQLKVDEARFEDTVRRWIEDYLDDARD